MINTSKPIISIITRAYNVEKYISECVKSVLNQSFIDFEWLIIENSSTDETRSILEQYAKQDERIRLFFNKKNYTGSFSREEGVYGTDDVRRIARGQYITNLDSDDFLHRDYLKILYEATKGMKVDIVAAGSVQFVNDDVNDVEFVVVPKEFLDDDITQMGNNIRDFYDAFRPLWGKLVSREFYISNLNYINNRPSYVSNGGDTFTCLRLLQLAKRCICVEKPIYFHRIRKDSISKVNYYRERYLCYNAVFFEGVRLLEHWNMKTNDNFYYLCLIHFGGMKMNLKMISSVDQLASSKRLEFVFDVLNDEVFRQYASLLSDEHRQNLEYDVDEALQKIYSSVKGEKDKKNILLFYKYSFSRRFISKKALTNSNCSEYEMILYAVSVISERNTIAYGHELLYLCIRYVFGKICNTLEEARAVIADYVNIEMQETEKKKKIARCIEKNDYDEIMKILDSFDENMKLDCDVLFAKACCFYAANDIENAILLLAIACELYPNEIVISENINSILEEVESC